MSAELLNVVLPISGEIFREHLLKNISAGETLLFRLAYNDRGSPQESTTAQHLMLYAVPLSSG